MRPVFIATLMLATALSSGCAVKKNFYATGGSRADGTVDMAYDFAQFEQPVVSLDQAQGIALQKCAVWGYRQAEAFGGQTTHCDQRDGWGNCVAGQVVVKYQCIGDLDAPKASTSAQNGTPSGKGALSKEQWQQQQLQQLNQQSGLSYEEYQRRYRQIMGP